MSFIHCSAYDRASCDGGSPNISSPTVSSTCAFTTRERIYVYSATTAFALVMGFVRALSFYYVCVNASRVLHNRMFRAILRVPVLFYDTNPSGKTSLLYRAESKGLPLAVMHIPSGHIQQISVAFECFVGSVWFGSTMGSTLWGMAQTNYKFPITEDGLFKTQYCTWIFLHQTILISDQNIYG